MATKNFAQMTTKKLNALLTTASDEDRALIEQELAARNQEAATIEAPVSAEKIAEEAPAKKETKAKEPKAPKLTHDELKALADTCRANLYHRCQVVPFNTATWVNGIVMGITEEHRSGKVLYRVKTEDGRIVNKVHDSELIKILDEVAEVTPKLRGAKAATRKEWTIDEMNAEIAEAALNVGKLVTFVENEGQEPVEGRIVAIVPEKRVNKIMYRINVPMPSEENPNGYRTVHKVATSAAKALAIAEEFDQVGADMQAKYQQRREAIAQREPVTPESRVLRCEELLKKAEESLAKAQAQVEARKAELEKAKAELAASMPQSGESDNLV